MSKGKLLAVCIIWLVIIAALAATYRWVISPSRKDNLRDLTDSDSRYDFQVSLSLDSFSGYAVLRSPEFRKQLQRKRILLDLVDDGADYGKRIRSLTDGDTQMAVFTIDALLKVTSDLDDLPATIVGVIDETRGADAMVAYKKAVPNVDALNAPEMQIVLTPDSPSETLARVVMTHFGLDQLQNRPFVTRQDAESVYKHYRTSNPNEPKAFVLWEPYVTKMLENPNTHVVVDSSRFRGYIVDVLVVNRDYLVKNQGIVEDVLGCYFRAAYHYRADMVQLVLDDAKRTGAPLTPKQAENLVNGIWWKNTQENFAHFGLREHEGVQLLEDMVRNLTKVLTTAGAIERDPTDGKAAAMFFDGLLRKLQTSSFHPGIDQETIRDEAVELVALDDAGWSRLVPIGTLEVPELVFARGTPRLTDSSRSTLDELVGTLNDWPQYYLLIKGNASLKGDDLQANQDLAEARALAAQQYLIDSGVNRNRVRAVGGEPSGRSSVTFVLGQPPY